MHLHLQPHPTSPCPDIAACEAELTRLGDGGLHLRFTLRGELARLRVPPPGPAARRDGLWAHTCFEVFIAAEGSPAYREFNLAPSGAWAIYDFSAYRVRLADPASLTAPRIEVHSAATQLTLDAVLAADCLPATAVLQAGLSAVVETRAGALSYWAIRHPGERPDFHHRDAFTLTLPTQP